MDSEIRVSSLDQLIGYYEHSSAESQISILKESYGLSDFNNVETADRKLIINNKLEFWVHDFVLNTYCDYFKVNLETARLKKNPYCQTYDKSLANQRNNVSVRPFNLFEDEQTKRTKPDDNNINISNINNSSINNLINIHNNIKNNVYSKYILKNTNINIPPNKTYKKNNKSKINKEQKKETNNNNINNNIDNNIINTEPRENKEMKELLDITQVKLLLKMI